ncbi:MAG: c-type cytochrome [Acidimicrobiia bacterium]|nr:c-type cytochrome [Acidimicrobiia bacterium]
MSNEHITTLAGQYGASEALIRRSAEARAAATGSSPEEILAAWTGGAPPPQPAATEPAESIQPSRAPSPEESRPDEAPPKLEEQPPTAAIAQQSAEEAPPITPTAAHVMAETVGRRSAFSPWMVAAFLVIPLFGLLYLVVNSNGVACGDGGRLEVAFDGSLVNCDGTPFEGRGGGGAEAASLLALGQEVYTAGAQCASCHGANGQGGTGPAMAGGAVIVTWPTCDDHIKWITLGSDGWSVAVGSTYGAEAKPVQGGMPGFEADLSDEELRAVTAFERIRFGGAPAEETLIACGLIVPAEAPSDAPTEPPAGETGSGG